ncbi:uncharacterized protein LOC116307633 [Actinia tenebrosa]|uniref:Uncharacterized protein LOC116307633 n=1 Tax=Actinia tenebrosa TaxID=6105 RepID=A0A6P8J1J2_ACTTE|nr:uncharacterized protein LOC116307633 [Actinia tenebrosa]
MWRFAGVFRIHNSLIQARYRSLSSVFTKVVTVSFDCLSEDHHIRVLCSGLSRRFMLIDGTKNNIRNFHVRNCVLFSKGIHENPRNQNIKAKTVLLIDSDGEKLGTVSLNEALDKAKEKSLHLVEIERQKSLKPAVCKLFSPKMIFESEKRAKHNSHGAKQKELTITGKIAPQDLKWKIQKIYDFLKNGNSVKLSIRRKPYQKISQEEKLEIVKKVVEEIQDVGIMEGEPKVIGALALGCHFKPFTQRVNQKNSR